MHYKKKLGGGRPLISSTAQVANPAAKLVQAQDNS